MSLSSGWELLIAIVFPHPQDWNDRVVHQQKRGGISRTQRRGKWLGICDPPEISFGSE